MKKRLSKISLGSANFGLNYGINNKKKIKFYEVEKILNFANKVKICKIDTAQSYGDSEKVIGKYIDKFKTKWNVTSKLKNLNLSLEDQFIISKLEMTNLILSARVSLTMTMYSLAMNLNLHLKI